MFYFHERKESNPVVNGDIPPLEDTIAKIIIDYRIRNGEFEDLETHSTKQFNPEKYGIVKEK